MILKDWMSKTNIVIDSGALLEYYKLLLEVSKKNHVKEELLPLYYQKLEEFKIVNERYYKSSELLLSCLNLQLFDLKRILQIINNDHLAQDIR